MLRFKNNHKNNLQTYIKIFHEQKTINNDLLANIIKGIKKSKGNDIDILDLRIDAVCDYFVATETQTHKLTQ
jgi:hypothetical protein